MKRDELITLSDISRLEEKIDRLSELITKKGKEYPKILKSEQVRELLGISSSSLQNLRNKNVIHYSKVAGTIYYKLDDIIKLIEDNSII